MIPAGNVICAHAQDVFGKWRVSATSPSSIGSLHATRNVWRFQTAVVEGDRRESDGLKKKNYSVDFQLEMDVFLQN